MREVQIIFLILIIIVLTSCNDVNSKQRSIPKTISISVPTENGENKQDFSFNYSECIDGIIQITKTIGDLKKYGFADSNKNIITEPIYDDSKFYIGASSANSGFNEGLAPVKMNDKWGYIDLKGKVRINFSFDDAWCFSEGLAAVCLNGKYGYINKEGNVVIGCTYSRSYDFHKGVAVVEDDGKFGFVNRNGAWIIKPEYEYVDFGRFDYEWTKNNVVRIQKDGLWGAARIIDSKVEIIAEPKYAKLYPYRDHKAKFVILYKDKNKCYTEKMTIGYIDEYGIEIQKWDGTDEEDAPSMDHSGL